MKMHHLFSLRVIVLVSLLFSSSAGPLLASSGSHKYLDRTALEAIIGLCTALNKAIQGNCPNSSRTEMLNTSACFVQEYGRELPGLLARDARYVACRPAGTRAGQPAYTLVARLPDSTNALRTAVIFQHNVLGWITSLSFDRPLTLADGMIYPAGTPVPVEPLMRALALRRAGLPPAPQTLTIKRAVQKTSYAKDDIAKVQISTLFRGSVPTTVESLFWITQFTITPFPLLTTDVVVQVLNRMDAGTKPSKHPKYTHLFVYSNATEKTPPFGFFMATLRNDTLDFIYKFKLDNRDTNLVATPDFEALRAYMSTNPPLHGLKFGRFLFAIDGAMHSASNVPMLGRVTKGSSSAGNVKPKREK
ncbi:MAG: hypothetical protein NTV22_14735 [bacterium]|nr:hypothetical protein [bacterium]